MITVEYRDFEEMKEFARQILGIGQQGALEGTSVVLPKEMPSATWRLRQRLRRAHQQHLHQRSHRQHP